MNELQSQVEHAVIAFRPRNSAVSTLTARDRLHLAQWHDRIRASGYRIVLYEREAGDSPEVGSFLSLYRMGEPWALWSMARLGAKLCVWCGRTSQDVGTFGSIFEALQALLPDCIPDRAENDMVETALLISLCRVS